MAEFVYQMYKARKAVGEKVILDDVTVGVYPGAKIGVVGPNGMGKSTLLKVIAGMEDVSNGEAKLTPGYTVGLLQQEPPLDETKTVKENIELAFGDLLAKIARFNEIGVEMGNPDADFCAWVHADSDVVKNDLLADCFAGFVHLIDKLCHVLLLKGLSDEIFTQSILMKYSEDSTVEKLERGYVCKTRGRVALHACAIRCARVRRGVPVRYGTRGRDAEREGATWCARTHLCQIICSKGVYIALKTSISCRLLDLGVFFASH